MFKLYHTCTATMMDTSNASTMTMIIMMTVTTKSTCHRSQSMDSRSK